MLHNLLHRSGSCQRDSSSRTLPCGTPHVHTPLHHFPPSRAPKTPAQHPQHPRGQLSGYSQANFSPISCYVCTPSARCTLHAHMRHSCNSSRAVLHPPPCTPHVSPCSPWGPRPGPPRPDPCTYADYGFTILRNPNRLPAQRYIHHPPHPSATATPRDRTALGHVFTPSLIHTSTYTPL